MSLSIKLKLLSVVDKLARVASRSEVVRKVVEEFPEATTRSALLTLYAERGRM